MLEFNNSASLLKLDKYFNNYKNALGKLVLWELSSNKDK